MSTSQLFSPLIARPLCEGTAMLLASENLMQGACTDGHQAEAVVQGMMAKTLLPLLPHPSLLKQNKLVLDAHDPLGHCIPDLIIDKVGGGHWAFIELKTLLTDDDLTVEEINRDLRKLCAYKDAHADSAAIFALVGSRTRLFNPRRKTRWESLPLRYEPDVFSASPPPRQQISEAFVAVPYGSYDTISVSCFLWEIQRMDEEGPTLSAKYRFKAEMVRDSSADRLPSHLTE